MSEWRSTRFRNPAAWYVLLGFVLLLFTLWVPWLSASRTARTEARADGLAEALLEATYGFEPPFEGLQPDVILARFHRIAEVRGLRTQDLERLPPGDDDTWLLLRNKHYAFRLGASPPSARQLGSRDAVPAAEVIAWPLNSVGPAHATFFYPENAPRAFTRNLRRGYVGTDEERSPRPAAGHRRDGAAGDTQAVYPGTDDERWLRY